MDDLISRKAAIDALNTQAEEMSHWHERYAEQRKGILTAVRIVSDIKPKLPEPCTDTISRKAALDAIRPLQTYKLSEDDNMLLVDKAEVQTELMMLPSAQPEIKPIDYQDCANAMMRMWMDNVVTDGEYNRIMDKLNAFWRTRNERFDRQTGGD